MRILYVVHRYGQDIVGGAETACRQISEHLVLRGHDVEVLTSCARSYVDWADHYQPGHSVENGVHLHRLSVNQPRDNEVFSSLHARILEEIGRVTLADQVEWLDAMGPVLKGQAQWLRDNASRFDVVVFMTYLYPTTAFGVPTMVGRVPVVIQPTAHDEAPIHLPFFRSLFEMADGFIFLTPEERDVVTSVTGRSVVGEVAGLGLSMDGPSQYKTRFRERFGLGGDPYLIYVGRIDTMKGVAELIRFFVEHKGRCPSRLKLVLAGDTAIEIPEYEGLISVGFLTEDEKREAIREALALVQPSPYESFSIVVCEAWREGRPVLVQGYSDVLSGQARRSQGGLPYTGMLEFDFCVTRLREDAMLADELGENGRNFVHENYDWDTVLDAIERSLKSAQSEFLRRS